MLDCNLIGKMFTDAELLTIGTALTGLTVAAVALCAAYVARIANRWRQWDR